MPRRFYLWLAGLAIVFSAYTAYWFILADGVERDFLHWQETQRQQGAYIAAAYKRMGFPWSVTLKLQDAVYEKAKNLHISSQNVKISVSPFFPFNITLAASTPTQIVFSVDGSASYSFSTQLFSATLQRDIQPGNANPQLHATFYNIGLDPSHKIALGNLVQSCELVAAFNGQVPAALDNASLAAWRDAGGVVQLSSLKILWGSLTVQGDGTLTLDKDLQPLAAFSTRLSGHEQAVDVLREQGQLQPLAANLIKAALKLLEDPQTAADKPREVKVPITLQDRTLAIAGVHVLNW